MNNKNLIGEVRGSRFPYFNSTNQQIEFKSRPVLIINCEKEHGPCDLTVLPISTIPRRKNINSTYDIFIDISIYNKLSLKRNCFCRTNKVSTVHSGELTASAMGNIKIDYPKLYSEIITKFKVFTDEISPSQS